MINAKLEQILNRFKTKQMSDGVHVVYVIHHKTSGPANNEPAAFTVEEGEKLMFEAYTSNTSDLW